MYGSACRPPVEPRGEAAGEAQLKDKGGHETYASFNASDAIGAIGVRRVRVHVRRSKLNARNHLCRSR